MLRFSQRSVDGGLGVNSFAKAANGVLYAK